MILLRTCLKTEDLAPLYTDGTDQEQAKGKDNRKSRSSVVAKDDEFDYKLRG
jgi:hypothetical protein